jgi:hypothetical protein
MYQFESSGNANIIVRATGTVNLLGITYTENDIVAVFNNAYFDLGFASNNKPISQNPITLLHYNVMNLDTITIEPKNLSYSHFNFMATNKIIDETVYIPMQEKITSDATGVAFSTRIPVNLKSVFIKTSDLSNATGYTIDYTTGQISGLSNNTTYTIFYYYEDVGLISYELDKVETPYFRIEITGENNVNGISRFIYLEIPKTSISIQPTLSFTQDTIATAELEFKVIGGKAKVIYY